ncbi:helix-turn-helix domain-containing protein [Streptomyces chartreusis]|uniref:helix-turn-helix domain-containing protein n=1 Tax=Streptomyces chartreusis TaxID=1969 RepID=UPI00382101A5
MSTPASQARDNSYGTGAVAGRLASCTPSSRYLAEHERIHIAVRLLEEASIWAVAAELRHSPSTVSREGRRNRTSIHAGSSLYPFHS